MFDLGFNRHRDYYRVVAPTTKRNQSIEGLNKKGVLVKFKVVKCNHLGGNHCEAKVNNKTYLLFYDNKNWVVKSQIK